MLVVTLHFIPWICSCACGSWLYLGTIDTILTHCS